MEILEIVLLSDRLKKTELFYKEKLGLTVLDKTRSSISFSVGRSVLTFLKSKNQNPEYHFAFNIPCNQINEAVTWASLRVDLLNAEKNEVIADFVNWNAKAFYFFDNNNNVLELIARSDLSNESATPFDSSALLCISEIGIVTDKVPETATMFKDRYDIPLYHKQPLRDNFAALGDENGLIILSSENREWYPTALPCRKHYCKIKLHNGDKTLEVVCEELNLSRQDS